MSLYLGTTPITPAVSDVANQSLSNLNSTGQNIANWSSNVTNCLVEIPQDIKLELNNGTLTLKSGSKVYVPNGFEEDGTTPKFDVVTFESDSTTAYTSSSSQRMFFFNITANYIQSGQLADIYSGDTAPTGSGAIYWYDTTNNIIKRSTDGGSTWGTDKYSLSLGLFSVSNNSISSIDQVFNGFGYVGTTVFALPDIKGLIPNGRNADGTLKNISFENTTVKTTNLSNGNRTLIIQNDGQLMGYLDIAYYEDENIIKNSSGDTQLACYLGHVIVESGKITRFETKSAFHAVDYSDSPTIAGWSMPSDRYIDLTLGASGASYTAPANGFFAASKESTGNGQYLFIDGSLLGTGARATGSGQTVECYLPVRAGDTVNVTYNAGGSTNYFRFVYAEGN